MEDVILVAAYEESYEAHEAHALGGLDEHLAQQEFEHNRRACGRTFYDAIEVPFYEVPF